MAEYITELANDIAKSCPDLVENGCGNDNCIACLAFKLIGLGYTKQNPTADVAPRAEVAREIFEEIESLLRLNSMQGDIFTGKYFDVELEADIAELKKKYTGGEDQNDDKG